MTEAILDYSTGWYNDSEYGKVTSCDEVDLLPKVYFLITGDDNKDYWAEWLPADYMIEIDSTQECQVCLYSHSEDNTMVLGNSFLRGYYAEFDKDAFTVSLAPNTESGKDSLVEGFASTRLRGYSPTVVYGLGSGMLVLIGLFMWMMFGIFCYSLKRTSKTETNVDSNLVEQLKAVLEEAKKKESESQVLLK